MPGDNPPHVIIVGAGLAGALLACDLARMGWRVDLYERRPDPRAQGFIGGRSINLALSTRGITALKRIGLDGPVLADAIPMPGRILHPLDAGGDTVFQPYSKNPDDAIRSVSRGGLNITLIEAADELDNVNIHFEHRCEDVDLDAPAAVFHNEATGETVRAAADAVIGADGAFSAVRTVMQKSGAFDYSQTFERHGYKELHIPPAADIPGGAADQDRFDGFAMDPNGLHIWPRGSAMMIALPNKDKSFTCTLFWPFHGEHSFESVERTGDGDAPILDFFRRWYPDAVPLMPTLGEDYRANPTSPLVTIRCGPWHHGGKVLLIGDAAHAIVPFFGQGMNAAFEDCRILAEMLESGGHDLSRVFPEFYERRKDDADAIADMALDNFIEMRDKVGSRLFRAKKKGEKTLHRLLPGVFLPLYNMVSFTNIPYAQARRRQHAQSRLLTLIAAVFLGLVLVALSRVVVLDLIFGTILLPLLATAFFYFAFVKRRA